MPGPLAPRPVSGQNARPEEVRRLALHPREGHLIKIAQAVRSYLVGRGSISDFGDRYPVLDSGNMSSVSGLFVIGNIAGTPDIRAALNSGSDVGRQLERELASTDDAPDVDHGVVIVGAGACVRRRRSASTRSSGMGPSRGSDELRGPGALGHR